MVTKIIKCEISHSVICYFNMTMIKLDLMRSEAKRLATEKRIADHNFNYDERASKKYWMCLKEGDIRTTFNAELLERIKIKKIINSQK